MISTIPWSLHGHIVLLPDSSSQMPFQLLSPRLVVRKAAHRLGG